MQVRQFVDEGLGNSAHLVISEPDGYHDLGLVDGGFEAWEAAGLPIERAHTRQSDEVRL